jgi:crotonobetainyl-CoA:carnitine CoA-transferase CaiB-like acyl-CoA transferase
MTNVMDGIRVLEVAEHTFVPLASAILADWGAEVIKIEHPERGDAMRGIGDSGGINVGSGGVHVLMEHANRGKRSLGLDLTTDEGREILYKLVEWADVFLTNKLPRVLSKLKIDVDDIRARNPNIVYVRGSGYGHHGPDADLGGYDSLGFWARSGVAAAAQMPEVDRMPSQSAPAVGDSIGAMFIAGGISTALLHRERTGEATVVDVSLLATGMWALSAGIAISQQSDTPYVGKPPEMSGRRNPLVGLYRAADNRWISLCMLQGFHYWPEAAQVFGHPEWVDDPRFASSELLFSNGAEAAALVAEAFMTADQATWKERLRGIKGQWAPVQDSLDIADDPMVEANGYIGEAKTADGIPFKLVATPVQFDGQPSPPKGAPSFNQHGDDILATELGLDQDYIIDLKVKGVVA